MAFRPDKECQAKRPCLLRESEFRKVISQFFGRNRTCTREIPEDYWILWCRRHYQRNRYIDRKLGVWHKTQLQKIRDQLDIFETIDRNLQWQITVSKKTLEEMKETPPCWEIFLCPYFGHNKTFTDVRHVLDIIDCEFTKRQFIGRRPKDKEFPRIRFLLEGAINQPDVKRLPVKKPVRPSRGYSYMYAGSST